MHEEKRHALREGVLAGEGDTDRDLREQIAELTTAHTGGRLGGVSLPDDALTEYVDTVARRAHATSIEHVEALREAGYSDDAIFEITCTTAVAAGLACVDRALAALAEDDT